MLTGAEILKNVKSGKIIITPFSEKQLNPNSYNLRLEGKLLEYALDEGGYLDSRKRNPTKSIIIGPNGYILQPGHFYLGSTIEYTDSGNYIPCISGRSSVARLGIEIHRTAGFGDIGFRGTWTLEITTPVPVKVYQGQEICQIYYESPEGDIPDKFRYHGKYLDQKEVTESKLYLD